jgi:hypothetical protein
MGEKGRFFSRHNHDKMKSCAAYLREVSDSRIIYTNNELQLLNTDTVGSGASRRSPEFLTPNFGPEKSGRGLKKNSRRSSFLAPIVFLSGFDHLFLKNAPRLAFHSH